jgi:hypothetical protein
MRVETEPVVTPFRPAPLPVDPRCKHRWAFGKVVERPAVLATLVSATALTTDCADDTDSRKIRFLSALFNILEPHSHFSHRDRWSRLYTFHNTNFQFSTLSKVPLRIG